MNSARSETDCWRCSNWRVISARSADNICVQFKPDSALDSGLLALGMTGDPSDATPVPSTERDPELIKTITSRSNSFRRKDPMFYSDSYFWCQCLDFCRLALSSSNAVDLCTRRKSFTLPLLLVSGNNPRKPVM